MEEPKGGAEGRLIHLLFILRRVPVSVNFAGWSRSTAAAAEPPGWRPAKKRRAKRYRSMSQPLGGTEPERAGQAFQPAFRHWEPHHHLPRHHH